MELTQDVSHYFPSSFTESRARFRASLNVVRERWSGAQLFTQPILNEHSKTEDDLSIDWIYAPALQRSQKLLGFTAGEHGMEGYVGAAMQNLFIDEMLPHLDAHNTALLFVHCINPWGMKYKRRTNSLNVDINRNFISDENFFAAKAAAYNPEYAYISAFVNPSGVIHSPWHLSVKKFAFFFQILWAYLTIGQAAVRSAPILGQYRFPQGIYYGGNTIQLETQTLINLFHQYFRLYDRIVHLDMHTGYGPRYQMSIVNSYLEKRSSQEMSNTFKYPSVVKTTPAEFYSIQGDMIDYIYTFAQNELPQQSVYATSFEFGTLGDSLAARFFSLQRMITENQLYWFGTSDANVRARIETDFQELYFPQDQLWQRKAIHDARQAFTGILNAERFLD